MFDVAREAYGVIGNNFFKIKNLQYIKEVKPDKIEFKGNDFRNKSQTSLKNMRIVGLSKNQWFTNQVC